MTLGRNGNRTEMPCYSVSARARFLCFDLVKSSVDASEVSQFVFHDAAILPPFEVFEESSQYTTLRETGLGHFCTEVYTQVLSIFYTR